MLLRTQHETDLLNEQRVVDDIQRLGPWFHNLHLSDTIRTFPNHHFGDFPNWKWQQLAPHLPASLHGWRVLDIGCNAGFYSFELARRGAKVLGIDGNPHFLAQARWAAALLGLTKASGATHETLSRFCIEFIGYPTKSWRM